MARNRLGGLDPVGENLAQFVRLRRHHGEAIALLRIASKILVVIFLGLKKGDGRSYFGDDGRTPDPLAIETADHRFGDSLLAGIMEKDGRAVLRADIMPLAVRRRRIVDREEGGEQRLEVDFRRVEGDLHHFGVTPPRADGSGLRGGPWWRGTRAS